jgi:hypothetical protein
MTNERKGEISVYINAGKTAGMPLSKVENGGKWYCPINIGN